MIIFGVFFRWSGSCKKFHKEKKDTMLLLFLNIGDVHTLEKAME